MWPYLIVILCFIGQALTYVYEDRKRKAELEKEAVDSAEERVDGAEALAQKPKRDLIRITRWIVLVLGVIFILINTWIVDTENSRAEKSMSRLQVQIDLDGRKIDRLIDQNKQTDIQLEVANVELVQLSKRESMEQRLRKEAIELIGIAQGAAISRASRRLPITVLNAKDRLTLTAARDRVRMRIELHEEPGQLLELRREEALILYTLGMYGDFLDLADSLIQERILDESEELEISIQIVLSLLAIGEYATAEVQMLKLLELHPSEPKVQLLSAAVDFRFERPVDFDMLSEIGQVEAIRLKAIVQSRNSAESAKESFRECLIKSKGEAIDKFYLGSFLQGYSPGRTHESLEEAISLLTEAINGVGVPVSACALNLSNALIQITAAVANSKEEFEKQENKLLAGEIAIKNAIKLFPTEDELFEARSEILACLVDLYCSETSTKTPEERMEAIESFLTSAKFAYDIDPRARHAGLVGDAYAIRARTGELPARRADVLKALEYYEFASRELDKRPARWLLSGFAAIAGANIGKPDAELGKGGEFAKEGKLLWEIRGHGRQSLQKEWMIIRIFEFLRSLEAAPVSQD